MPNNIVIQNIDNLVAKNLATTVKFEWGSNFSQSSYYIAWTNDTIINSVTYTSIPELEAKIEKQHGGSEDAPSTIQIPNTYSPIDKLARPFPHSDCRATIGECDPSDPNTTFHILYFGYVTKIVLGKFGSNKMTEITISGLKSQLKFASGIPANSDCVLSLFDENCKVVSEEYEAIIQSISSEGITLNVSTPVLATTTTELPGSTTTSTSTLGGLSGTIDEYSEVGDEAFLRDYSRTEEDNYFTGWQIEITSGAAEGYVFNIDGYIGTPTCEFYLSEGGGWGILAGDTYELIAP